MSLGGKKPPKIPQVGRIGKRKACLTNRPYSLMLIEAKHLWPFFRAETSDQRLKAWPRGVRPLRCSFASHRMTKRNQELRHCLVSRPDEFFI